MREVSGGNELLCVLTVGNYIHVLSHVQPRPSQGASAVLCALRTAWGVGTQRGRWSTGVGAGVRIWRVWTWLGVEFGRARWGGNTFR